MTPIEINQFRKAQKSTVRYRDGRIVPKRPSAVSLTTVCIRCREAGDCHCTARSARPIFALAA